MTDDQQRARELLAAEYRKEGLYGQVDHTHGAASRAAIAAITAALRAAPECPEGFVMVPVEPTERMIGEGILAYNGKCEESYRAMLAARPQEASDA